MNSCEYHDHPILKRPVARHVFIQEFSYLAKQAGVSWTSLELTPKLAHTHHYTPRRYAEMDPEELRFYFAPQVLWLPEENRLGLIAHELGHALCQSLPNGGTEEDADLAAEEALGARIIYDKNWPDKGLQTLVFD